MKPAALLVLLFGAAPAADLALFQTVRASDTVLEVGADCSKATPCNARIGSVVYSVLQKAKVTLKSGTGTAYIYIASNGMLTVGHNVGLQCEDCVAEAGVDAFPPDALPLWMWPVSNGKWDREGSDLRTGLSMVNLAAESGIVLTRRQGEMRIGLSPALTRRSEVPRSASAACAEGDWAADAQYLYICVAANQWRRAALAAW